MKPAPYILFKIPVLTSGGSGEKGWDVCHTDLSRSGHRVHSHGHLVPSTAATALAERRPARDCSRY